MGALVGGGIGVIASTYSASFGQDRQRQIRLIGVAKALREDVRRIREGLAEDEREYLHGAPMKRTIPPAVSSWAQGLLGEIALDSPAVVAKCMELEAELTRLSRAIREYEPAQAEAERLNAIRRDFDSGNLFSTNEGGAEQARRVALAAQSRSSAVLVEISRAHEYCVTVAESLMQMLAPLADQPIPERVPWPNPQ